MSWAKEGIIGPFFWIPEMPYVYPHNYDLALLWVQFKALFFVVAAGGAQFGAHS
jgi:hypothetical protein